MEQFTKEELSKISAENKKDEKKFKWLTRSDVEKRTNPSFNSFKNDADLQKEKNQKKKTKDSEKAKYKQQGKNPLKNDKNKKVAKKPEKKSDKTNNKDGERKYTEQV